MSLTTTTDNEMINVLRASLYPGAKTESIELVLSYCRVNGLDPMLKPVHIVPTSVKVGNGWEMRDVLMPGIADYRIKAARSGEYLGKSEPIYGTVRTEELDGVRVTFPEWCKITIRRSVGGKEAEFTATEYWMENYATKKRDTIAPNAMWQKRAFGQLAKCTEAQVLRMAFPEFSGGQPTAEEMEGKTIEGVAEPVRRPAPVVDVPAEPQPRPKWMAIADAFAAVVTAQDYYEALDRDGERIAWLKANKPEAFEIVDAARQAASERMTETPVAEAPASVEAEEMP